jgi:DNA-binding GntR family transcriptional regulator
MNRPKASNTPPYLRIAAALRRQITSGELPPGAQLPTENELAKQWGVVRQTARNGIAQLVSEGLVVRERPRGNFVRHRELMDYWPQEESRAADAGRASVDGHPATDVFVTQIAATGRVPSQEIQVEMVTAGRDVAGRLRVPVGTLVVARRRVRYINGQPTNINDSHYPLDVVRDTPIMSPEDVPEGTNQLLADLGYPQVRAFDEIFVRMPDPEEIQRLDLGPGTPIAVHYVTGYTGGDRPVRCTINVLPGDLHRICIDRPFERKWN